MSSKKLTIKLTADDKEVVKYLHILWSKNEPSFSRTTIVPDIIETPFHKSEFKRDLKNSLNKLSEIYFTTYQHLKLEENMTNTLFPLDKITQSDNGIISAELTKLTKKNIKDIYKYQLSNQQKKKELLKKFSVCRAFAKYKSGDTSKPNSFRYMISHHNVIKINDKLWVIDLVNKCGDNVPNKQIYKSYFGKQPTEQTVDVAIKNTMNYDNVVLLDIQKAYDSVDWDAAEELLISNLTRKINHDEAIKMVNQYMVVIKNRKLFYNKTVIKVYKGIPTGLSSSIKVFTLIIEEIIERWLDENKELYVLDKDFILNVYVDDIYIKFIKTDNAAELLNSLIANIEKYMFIINKAKSKADRKLYLPEFPNKLTEQDFYLGIPFTRNIELYKDILLEEYQTRHNHKLTWIQIYDKLISNDDNLYDFNKPKQSILGYLRYKLKPIIDISQDEPITSDKIINFIKSNFIFPYIEL